MYRCVPVLWVNITVLYLHQHTIQTRFIDEPPIIIMEFTIRTMMIVVLGIIALLILMTIFMAGQDQSAGMLGGLFEWFKVLGGGV